MTTPGSSPAPATSATSASLTTSVRRLEADAPHDAAHGLGVGLAIDAGDAEADRRRLHIALAERRVHHRVEHLLDLELAGRLQVRAAAARLGDDAAVLVREQADGLGPAGIDAQHVHVDS